jgi:type IV pilus assembly protein PilM
MKLNLGTLGRRRSSGTRIGIDVGASTLKVAVVSGERPKLRTAAVLGLGRAGAEGDAPALLTEFLRRERVPRPWSAVSALPSAEAEIRILNVPAGEPSTLPQRVMQTADRVLPFGTEDTILDFFSLGRALDGEEKAERVLLTAASRTNVEAHLKTLEAAGVVPEAVELAPWALLRAVRFFGFPADEAPFAILDFGALTSTLMVFNGGSLFLSRPVRIGSRHLTDRLRKELHLDWDRAEQLKGERGLTLAARACQTGTGAEGGTLVSEILDDLLLPTLEALAREIERSLAYVASETQGEVPEQLILAGGGAAMRNLDAFLKERLGLEVRVIGPGEGSDAVLPAGAEGAGGWPVLAIALGLSLRNTAARAEEKKRT